MTIVLKANQKRPTGYPYHGLYRFPEFQEAKITWADKSVSYHPLKMNYNFFTGEMNVINEKGDTVKFRRGPESKILNLDGDIFFSGFGTWLSGSIDARSNVPGDQKFFCISYR